MSNVLWKSGSVPDIGGYFEWSPFAIFRDLVRWATGTAPSTAAVESLITNLAKFPGWPPMNAPATLGAYIAIARFLIKKPDAQYFELVELPLGGQGPVPVATKDDWVSAVALSMATTTRMLAEATIPVAVMMRATEEGMLCRLKLSILDVPGSEVTLLSYHPGDLHRRPFVISEEDPDDREKNPDEYLAFGDSFSLAWKTACARADRKGVCALWSLHSWNPADKLPGQISGASLSGAAARAWTMMLLNRKVDSGVLVATQIKRDGAFYPVGRIAEKVAALVRNVSAFAPDVEPPIDRVAVVGEINAREATSPLLKQSDCQIDVLRIDAIPIER